MGPPVSPLPYHLALRDWLQTHEPDVWRFFAEAKANEARVQEERLQLLQHAYRLERESHPLVFAEADAAAVALGIEVPIQLLQLADAGQGSNAMIFSRREEVTIAFTGPLLELVDGLQLRAVFGHELAHHHHLWRTKDGTLHAADRLLAAAASDAQSDRAFAESARRWRLFTEIFADRGALLACGDLPATVAALVKTSTGLREVSGESYLRQVAEVFAQTKPKTDRTTHPEDIIRARALALWHEEGAAAEEKIAALIAGAGALGELDLLEQQALRASTRLLLHEILAPIWGRSELRLAHARDFLPDYEEGPGRLPEDAFAERSASIREYAAAVLYDFVTVDPELGQLPLCSAFQISDRVGVAKEFDRLAAKEMGLKVRDLKERRQTAAAALGAALEIEPTEA